MTSLPDLALHATVVLLEQMKQTGTALASVRWQRVNERVRRGNINWPIGLAMYPR